MEYRSIFLISYLVVIGCRCKLLLLGEEHPCLESCLPFISFHLLRAITAMYWRSTLASCYNWEPESYLFWITILAVDLPTLRIRKPINSEFNVLQKPVRTLPSMVHHGSILINNCCQLPFCFLYLRLLLYVDKASLSSIRFRCFWFLIVSVQVGRNCLLSWLSESVFFDMGVGEVFVVRNSSNVCCHGSPSVLPESWYLYKIFISEKKSGLIRVGNSGCRPQHGPVNCNQRT